MSKHTPGEWGLAQGANGDVLVTSWTDESTLSDDICHVYGGNDGHESQAIADAKLISAAPDMFWALQALHDACEHWEDQNDPVLENARKAIAKAKGGE